MSKIITLVGAPACGKTTLSLNLVTQLKIKNKNARYILEYPRDYIERFGHPNHISEQMLIFIQWKRLLDSAFEINYEYLICDSPLFIAYVYGIMKADLESHKDKMFMHELLDMCLETVNMYDKIFYIKSGKEFPMSDNLRHSNKTIQKSIDDKIQGFLSLYRVPYEIIINSDLNKSTNEILKKIC